MSRAEGPAVLVIGVGNAYRRDDSAGLEVARSVRRIGLEGVDVVEESGEGVALLEAWADAQRVILIDAARSGGVPGDVYRFDIPGDEMPSKFFHYSTHAFSIAEAIGLGRELDLLPPRLTVYGIEGSDFSSGEGLSAEVRAAAESVVHQILAELRGTVAPALQGENPCTNTR